MKTGTGSEGGIPPAWRERSRGSLGGIAVFGILAVATLGLAAVATLHSMWWGVLSALLVSAGCACEMFSWVRSTWFSRWNCDVSAIRIAVSRVEVGRGSLVIGLDISLGALAGPGIIVFGIGYLNGWISIYTPLPGWIYAATGVGLGTVLLGRSLFVGVRDQPFMALSATGFELPHEKKRYSWEDVARCTALPMKGDRRGGAWMSISPSYSGRPAEFRVDESGLGAPMTLRLLDFYRRHPELRDELTDQRVLRRVRDGSLLEESSA